MANYTPNYGLHQWEPGDKFLRTDFNQDLQIIDSALGDKTQIVIGSYEGSENAYYSSQEIILGFSPRAVLVFAGRDANEQLDDLPAQMATAEHSGAYLIVTETGFRVQNYLNMTSLGPYRYWIIP